MKKAQWYMRYLKEQIRSFAFVGLKPNAILMSYDIRDLLQAEREIQEAHFKRDALYL